MRTIVLLGLLALGGCAHPAVDFEDAPKATSEGGTTGGGDASGSITEDAGDFADTASPSTCTYPPGPYGIDQDSIVAPTMTWQGYVAGSSTVSTIRMSDLYDCDGKKGINAILADTSAVWCGPCNQESSQLESVMQTQWNAEGVQVLVLIWQDLNRNPATMSDVTAWKSKYGLDMVNVALDTQFQFAHPNSTVSMPTNMLIDPRTMKIVAKGNGYGGGPDPVVSQLANANKH